MFQRLVSISKQQGGGLKHYQKGRNCCFPLSNQTVGSRMSLLSLFMNMKIKDGMWWNGEREKGFEDTEQIRGSWWVTAVDLLRGQLLSRRCLSRAGNCVGTMTTQLNTHWGWIEEAKPGLGVGSSLTLWLKTQPLFLVWLLRKEGWLPK